MRLTIQTAMASASDAKNWTLTAYCVLANPLSQKLGPDLVLPLFQIASQVDLQAPVRDVEKFMRGMVWLIENMEADHARQR